MIASIRYWFCVGGLLKQDLAELFFTLLPGRRFLINMYGEDEDLGTICYQVIDSLEHVQRLNYHGRYNYNITCNIKLISCKYQTFA
jgi:hypothetical protein